MLYPPLCAGGGDAARHRSRDLQAQVPLRLGLCRHGRGRRLQDDRMRPPVLNARSDRHLPDPHPSPGQAVPSAVTGHASAFACSGLSLGPSGPPPSRSTVCLTRFQHVCMIGHTPLPSSSPEPNTGDELNNSIIVGKYHQHLQSTPPTKSYGKEMANQKDELAEKFLADYRAMPTLAKEVTLAATSKMLTNSPSVAAPAKACFSFGSKRSLKVEFWGREALGSLVAYH
ncbi:uncharacterized protein [Triticum aestivum]|uniref:uncharacterized protein n=1 Tax=Triticum aestivum TaxID=4565 RepID=UPI001D00CE53|nr:uncharacterized protein LOC123138265 [Triticum aestivum]